MLKEEYIYITLKEWLRRRCWQIIGGEPPAGTNDVPRVEIKDPSYRGKGSKGSRKVDLVCFKEGFLLLTEIKVRFSQKDAEKLEEITQRRELREALLGALRERHLLPLTAFSNENYIEKAEYLVKSLAFNYPQKAPCKDFVFFMNFPNISVRFGPEVSPTVRDLFSVRKKHKALYQK